MVVEARLRSTERRIATANGLEVRERVVDIASPPGRVRLLESGVGDPVLFMNGISAPGIGMAALAGLLPGHQHLLVDLPGHGLSPPHPWHGAPVRQQAVTVLTELLDGLGFDQVTLVGNSLGGLFSLWLALDQPSRVARAVIVGQPAVAFAGARGDLIMAMVSAPVFGRMATWGMRLPTPRSSARWMVRGAFGHHAARAVSNDIIDAHFLPMRVPGQAASFRSLQRRLTAGRTPRPEHQLTDAELRSFTVPLLFVWGDDDAFLSPIVGGPSVAKIPTARLVTMPGGHFPWYDDPDRCASLVAEGL
jgi:pimeloyl-ACP methyl ester carboxylesterase